MIEIKHKGNFRNSERFLTNAQKLNFLRILNVYGAEGVRVLSDFTPKDTGETSRSWGFRTAVSDKGFSLKFTNVHSDGIVPIVILLQYGHATRGGHWIQGRDFINPAIQPIFDKMTEDLWREVKAL